jgi:hypothetical protein
VREKAAQARAIRAKKETSHNLRMATVAVMLAFAATGGAHVRAIDHTQSYPAMRPHQHVGRS